MQIQLQDFLMAYRESGTGIPLLLIHGFPLNSGMWEPQLTGLADSAWCWLLTYVVMESLKQLQEYTEWSCSPMIARHF